MCSIGQIVLLFHRLQIAALRSVVIFAFYPDIFALSPDFVRSFGWQSVVRSFDRLFVQRMGNLTHHDSLIIGRSIDIDCLIDNIEQ